MISELLAEREIDERSTQLAIAIAGSGWSGEAAKELFSRFEQARREISAEIAAENGSEVNDEPEPQIALSAEEFRKQVGA